MIKVIEKRKIWFALSLTIIIIGLCFGIYRGGLNFGIDFKGGTVVTVKLGENFDKSKADEIIKKYAPQATTNTVNSDQLEIKDKVNNLDSVKVNEIMTGLKEEFKVGDDALVSQNEKGASVGKELTEKAIIAITLAILGMLIYVAIRFKFDFGIAAIIALVHDILITLSMYTIFNIPINSPFIAAILTIVGYSMNDTVVIFDRIRENGNKKGTTDPTRVADMSVNQTISRSINTSLTTLIAIISVFILVPSIRTFTFPLMVGILSGAYSSIFIASPVWVMLKNYENKKKAA